MGNFKVKVNSEAESREIQSILESIGFRERDTWNESGSIGGFIWTDSDMTFCDNKIRYFDESPREELTLPELRSMVKPMKEYLDANRNYEFVLSTEKDDGFIEIPEGADKYVYFNEYDNANFYKGDFDAVWQDDGYWDHDMDDYKSYCKKFGVVVWQRDQDEPFLTPETTLNDQYAEIEKVRQTLNERQSQYGSFKDVADTTAVFMDQFALDRMSNIQREALHMICSKLARIANGDPNHADSWHDIAGYATLVVDDLES